jgi:hypothetical protein
VTGNGTKARAVSGLRRLASAPAATPQAGGQPRDGERCDLCGREIPADHRHMLQLEERRIDCSCETCWSTRSGDPEYRPVGTRTLWLPQLEFSDEHWASFAIPIGLAFFMRSSVAGGIVGLYPSPAGATESELDLGAWEAVCALNPVLEELEADGEALIVNRLADPPQYAIAPIDDCYRLVGIVKTSWEGISGGPGLEAALRDFFDELRERAPA